MDIIILTKVAEPFDHLGGSAAIELQTRGPRSQTSVMGGSELELLASSSAWGNVNELTQGNRLPLEKEATLFSYSVAHKISELAPMPI